MRFNSRKMKISNNIFWYEKATNLFCGSMAGTLAEVSIEGVYKTKRNIEKIAKVQVQRIHNKAELS